MSCSTHRFRKERTVNEFTLFAHSNACILSYSRLETENLLLLPVRNRMPRIGIEPKIL